MVLHVPAMYSSDTLGRLRRGEIVFLAVTPLHERRVDPRSRTEDGGDRNRARQLLGEAGARAARSRSGVTKQGFVSTQQYGGTNDECNIRVFPECDVVRTTLEKRVLGVWSWSGNSLGQDDHELVIARKYYQKERKHS